MDVKDFLVQNSQNDLLRISTAGSVDDGKSTLIGKMLYDSKLIYEDHIASVESYSKSKGEDNGQFDYSLLLDGLKFERDQKITIDVAYRYFSTPKRKFIIADTPGHIQYTRNMATGASNADLAIILIDARKGVIEQSKRHSFIMSILGIKHIVVAINKMDLMDYDEEVFEKIKADFIDFSTKLNLGHINFIPVSALYGENIIEPSDKMKWYTGLPILRYLENIHIASDQNLIDLRFPVQYVIRPNQDFRGYAGTVSSGIVKKGDTITVIPSGKSTKVKSIITFDGELEEAFPPMSVTLTLEDEIDITRGDMLVHEQNIPKIENEVEALLIWMNDAVLEEGNKYTIKHTTNSTRCVVSDIRFKINVNTLHRDTEKQIGLNDISRVKLTMSKPLFHDPYIQNKYTGSFILIDELTNLTVAAGTILDRNPNEYLASPKKISAQENVSFQKSHISNVDRIDRYKQESSTIWLTGLPNSGKSSIAFALEKKLFENDYKVMVLDGENFRLGVSKDLDFSGEDRSENIRRASETAKLCNASGLIVIAAFVTPFEADRKKIKEIIGDRYLEVFVDTPLETCIERNNSKIFDKAQKGELKNVSGINSPYEEPKSPDLKIDMEEFKIEAAVNVIYNELIDRKLIS